MVRNSNHEKLRVARSVYNTERKAFHEMSAGAVADAVGWWDATVRAGGCLFHRRL